MAVPLTTSTLVPLTVALGTSALVALAALAPARTPRVPAQLDEVTRRRLMRQGAVTTARRSASRADGRPVG
ncbi:MAG: hypothetical protein J2P18_19755 [Nocardia sp.]|nr:hypothetical protein [Nocardia sp.]